MTVQEAKERLAKKLCHEKEPHKFCRDSCMYGEEHCEVQVAIKCMKEVEQYRALGTVEELENQKHNLSVAYKCIEELQQKDWIPCEVDMPKELGRYIVTLKDGRSLEGIYDNISKRFIMYEHEVIAWQPLPAPYKKDHLGEATGMVKEGDSDAS